MYLKVTFFHWLLLLLLDSSYFAMSCVIRQRVINMESICPTTCIITFLSRETDCTSPYCSNLISYLLLFCAFAVFCYCSPRYFNYRHSFFLQRPLLPFQSSKTIFLISLISSDEFNLHIPFPPNLPATFSFPVSSTFSIQCIEKPSEQYYFLSQHQCHLKCFKQIRNFVAATGSYQFLQLFLSQSQLHCIFQEFLSRKFHFLSWLQIQYSFFATLSEVLAIQNHPDQSTPSTVSVSREIY